MKQPKNFVPTPYTYHQEIELEITSLTNLGDGVGRHNGWVVMVPYTLPGERIKARIWRNKSNYSDGDLVEVLQASAQRATPRCPLFGDCGGCQYQHYAYEGQLQWKQQQIKELFKRLAGIETEIQPTHPSPREYAYRSKITPHFQLRKNGEDFPIGFDRASSRSIVDVPQCPIATDAINEALPGERERIRKNRRKFKRGGTLLLRDCLEGVTSDNRASVTQKVNKRVFQFIAGEFFQNNPYIIGEMVDYALEQAKSPGISYLVDAYCGVGVFAICGSDRFTSVYGVEVNSQAIVAAQGNLLLNQVQNCKFLLGSAEAVFEKVTTPPQETAVLIDPPRKGCDKVFLDQLFAYAPARVVYVSCGPDTQARDLKEFLANGYELQRVQPFDLFPQTRHIENVVTLVRR